MMIGRSVGIVAAVALMVVCADAKRNRIADSLPPDNEIFGALIQAKDMKVSKLVNALSRSSFVKSSLKRAAADIGAHQGVMDIVMRLAKDPVIKNAIGRVAQESKDLTLQEFADLRKEGSDELKRSVRSALDTINKQELAKPVASHLRAAFDASDVDDSLLHIRRALTYVDDVLDENEKRRAANFNAAQKKAAKKSSNLAARWAERNLRAAEGRRQRHVKRVKRVNN